MKNNESTRTRAAADIVAAVERQILRGELAPGQRLDEAALAKAFGVSRTPVREAVLELAALGLVEQRPHRGAFVTEVTLEEIFDVYEVLAELEGLCARLAARRMDEKERDELLKLHGRMGKLTAAEDREQYIALDYRFHGLLIRAARSATCSVMIRSARSASPSRMACTRFSCSAYAARMLRTSSMLVVRTGAIRLMHVEM